MDEIIKSEILSDASKLAGAKHRYAYYMEPVKGGYQLHRLTIEEDVVLEDSKVEDPDGWPEALGYLEAEFAKEHFSK